MLHKVMGAIEPNGDRSPIASRIEGRPAPASKARGG
jgi:hypothetical protein